ncbi:alpha/beta fold hydrolase [Tunturibacter empetritectus]|uniref:Pimeloyl-ACP methyl ester carboxylesterase n=1 Tax=Tunturiibacter lichenicola TaxID=2051959 RepID=A0A7W8J5J4_9BACT|nr:alpha/beta fold hydrolase [Edaphobacter lichenicola]MBB5343050.1 pimeloyl-ACP methyl ester carboxylesterase [Edaphobacter lichenicola]
MKKKPTVNWPTAKRINFAKLVTLFIWCVASLPLCGAGQASRPPTSRQQLWDIGSKSLFLSCAGTRHGPAVILESGRGRTSSDWSKVQPDIAAFTQVCSYDRDGLGQSRPQRSAPEDAAQFVDDLHRLLAVATIQPPYILVGHSLGGLLVRLYQTKYPGTVKGLVLVDPVHGETWRALQVDPNAFNGQTPEQIRRTGQLPPTERLEWHTDIPLIVLGHGKPIDFPPPLNTKSAQIEANFLAADKDLASRSSNGHFRLAEQSGHFIQIDEPELVSKAIREVWDAAVDSH